MHLAPNGQGTSRDLDEVRAAVVDRRSVPVLEVDPASGRVWEANEAFVEASGWSPTQLLGSIYRVCIHPGDWSRAALLVDSLGSGNPVEPRSLRLVRSDGSWRRRAWSGVPRLDPDRERPVTLVCRPDPGFDTIPPSQPARRTGSAAGDGDR